jgi:diguanylate cyclase (GGDEF)-like protein
MKVLLIEDTLTLLLLTSDIIEQAGHQVITARDGEEGIRQFLGASPDLILLDVQMPKMNGYEVARRIRALDAEHWIPIIFLSGMVKDQDIAMGIEAGGDDYLTKPVSQAVLGAKLKAMQRIADMRARLVQASRELERANRELELRSHMDGLTGIANRRHFDVVLQREWRRCAREGVPLSLLFMDVDCFKQYNDNYGHLKGDQCLKDIAQALRHCLQRAADLGARYGGEEFAVILSGTDTGPAMKLAENVRQTIEALAIAHEYSGAAKQVTASIGCATLVPRADQSPDSLISLADTALYRAKSTGRNRVVSAEQTPTVTD